MRRNVNPDALVCSGEKICAFVMNVQILRRRQRIQTPRISLILPNPANKDYSRWPYSSEIREVLRDTVMTFFSLRSRHLEVVGGERARERETISRVVYKASCWDCQEYIGKTKRRFNDRKTEHLSASD